MSDYKPANIDALAKAVYKKQSDYYGAGHEGYCVEDLKITLQSFEDRIKSLQEQLDREWIPKVFILCGKCNSEFQLKGCGISGGAEGKELNSTMENCPHCGERNDTWLRIPLSPPIEPENTDGTL